MEETDDFLPKRTVFPPRRTEFLPNRTVFPPIRAGYSTYWNGSSAK